MSCKASGAVGEDGSAVKDDPTLKLLVESQTGRTAAKLVDLDPQFQFASGIWGLRISLTLDDAVLMSAVFQPACFRDIFFGRVAGIDGSPAAHPPGSPDPWKRLNGGGIIAIAVARVVEGDRG